MIICAIAVSLPTLVALNKIDPDLFNVPATMSSPSFFSTGIGSPVNIDSSIDVLPCVTTPSTGTFSPGLTLTMSLINTCSIAISMSLLSRKTRAVLACKPIKRFIASLVFPLAFTSSAKPRLIKPIIMAVASK